MFREIERLLLLLATVLTVSQMLGGLSRVWRSVHWASATFWSALGQAVLLGIVGYLHRGGGAGGSGPDSSLLMWAFALALWSMAAAVAAAGSPTPLARRAVGLLGVVSFGCLVCLLVPPEPWSTLSPFAGSAAWCAEPHERGDAYRLALYAGSTGFAVPFATAIAAMFENESDRSWARHASGWAFAAWAWLSLALALAVGLSVYRSRLAPVEIWEEPVKSVALMEWLASIALLYSLLLTARRGIFGSGTLLLATVIFPATFLGVLLVPIRISAAPMYRCSLDSVGDLVGLVLVRVMLGSALMLYAWKLVLRGTG